MACAGGHEREGSCAELVATGLLEFIPDSHHEGALHDRHVLIRVVPVRWYRYPSGILIRSVNGPGFDGSPSRAAA